MQNNPFTCEQVKSIILEDRSVIEKARFDAHLQSCTECRLFYQLHQTLEATFQEDKLPETPEYIKQRLMQEFLKSEKTEIKFLSNLKNVFQPPYRTAIAFVFSVLFIIVLAKPYLSTEENKLPEAFSLFERQDSLILHNLNFVQTQNLGLNSKSDTLLNKFLQVFP